MNSQLTIGLLSGAMLLAMSSCNNIERDKKDVGTTAAVSMDGEKMETTPLETTQLATLNADPIQEDTIVDPNATAQNPDETYTETEVVRIDTVSTRIVYDIRRRTIEEVDTVGATKTYEVKKTVLKRTVMLDTMTQTEDEEQTVAFQKGDFKKLDEQIKTDTVVEVIDYSSSQQRTTPTPSAQPAPATQPEQSSSASAPDTTQTKSAQSSQPGRSSSTNASESPQSTQSNATQSKPNSPASGSNTEAGSAVNSRSEQSGSGTGNQSPQLNQGSQARETPAPANSASPTDGTAKQDTTRRSDSGS